MSNKFAWTWNIKKDKVDEYVKMHGEVWESVLEEHNKAGIRNYSIFQNNNQFIYVYECDDINYTTKYIANSEACQKWDAITSKMVEGSFDWGDKNSVDYLKEVFYLK
jgi:L-rhamnose mutarotase